MIDESRKNPRVGGFYGRLRRERPGTDDPANDEPAILEIVIGRTKDGRLGTEQGSQGQGCPNGIRQVDPDRDQG